jgi:hypothetical protein
MAEITISLNDEQLKVLNEISSDFGITAEQLARLSIQDLLNAPDPVLNNLIDQVVNKNRDLYQRLAG